MELPEPSHFLTTKEASKISGYNSNYLGQLCKEEKIVGRKVGRSWTIDSQSLHDFVLKSEERKREIARALADERIRLLRKKSLHMPRFVSTLAPSRGVLVGAVTLVVLGASLNLGGTILRNLESDSHATSLAAVDTSGEGKSVSSLEQVALFTYHAVNLMWSPTAQLASLFTHRPIASAPHSPPSDRAPPAVSFSVPSRGAVTESVRTQIVTRELVLGGITSAYLSDYVSKYVDTSVNSLKLSLSSHTDHTDGVNPLNTDSLSLTNSSFSGTDVTTEALTVSGDSSFSGILSAATSTLGDTTVNGSLTLASLTGSAQCLHVDVNGLVSGTGVDCGSGGGGGGGVSTTSPNTWTALQQFNGNASTTALTVSGATFLPGGIWNSSGAVGVGTTNPGEKVQVNGRVSADSFAVGQSTHDYTNNAPWYGVGLSSITIPNAGATSQTVQVAGYYGLDFVTNFGNAVFTQDGNFGIGTDTPTSRLGVQGNAYVAGKVTANVFNADSTSNTILTTNGQVVITADVAGNSVSSGFFNSVVSGNNSAFGLNNSANGSYSSAYGFSNTSSGYLSSAFGSQNTASNNTSLAFGASNNVSGTQSSAFGYAITNAIDFSTMIGPSDGSKLTILKTQRAGFGTTSPYANFAIQANNGDTNRTLFAIGSSTASATSTLFSIDNTGAITGSNGNFSVNGAGGTLTLTGPSSGIALIAGNTQFRQVGLDLGFLFNDGTGISVADVTGAVTTIGLSQKNLVISAGNTGPGIVWTSGTLAAAYDTGISRFSAGTVSIGTGAQGSAAGTLLAGAIGLGTTSPYAKLSVVATSTTGIGSPTTLFVIASTTGGTATSTLFTVTNTGNVGIGTAAPTSLLSIASGAASVGGIAVSSDYPFALDVGKHVANAQNVLVNIAPDNATAGATLSRILEVDGSRLNNSSISEIFSVRTQVNGSTLFNVLPTGNIGVASSTPWGLLSVNPNGIAGPAFVIGSSTATQFMVDSRGGTGNGVSIVTTAAGNGATISTLSTNASESLTITQKGFGQLNLGIGGSITNIPGYVQFNGQNHNTNNGADFAFVGTNTAGITANAEQNQVLFDFVGSNANHVSLNGSIALQRDFYVHAGNHSFLTYSAANLITDAATLSIDAPITIGANGKVTNAYALLIGSTTEGTMFNASTTNTYGLTVNAAKGALNNYAATFLGGSVGIGTTSPYAQLSIHTNNGATATTLFAIGSSTATATTTLFVIKNTGTVGINTGTPNSAYVLDVNGNSNINGTLFSQAGWFTQSNAGNDITGLILQHNASLGSVSQFFENNNNSGSGVNTAKISSAIVSGTAGSEGATLTFSTISGGVLAERFRIASTSAFGIGTTSPYAKLSLQANTNDPSIFSTLFAIGSSTATATTTLFTVLNTGAVGIGTTTPYGLVAFDNAAGSASQSVLTIKGNASQTGDYLGMYNAAGSKIASINQFGIFAGTSVQTSAAIFTNQAGGSVPLTVYSVFGGTQTADIFDIGQNGIATPFTVFNKNGYEGIGTSSPWAKLAISANANDANPVTTLFAIGSSTASATSTLFVVNNTGSVGIGTTTPYGLLSINPSGIGAGPAFVVGSSTETWLKVDNGGRLQIGSPSISGAVATFGNGNVVVANTGYSLTWSGASGANLVLTGFNNGMIPLAVNGNGAGQTGDLFDISKTSGTIIDVFNNNGWLGIGSTSPYAKLGIQANPNDAAVSTTLFAIGSSTASATSTLFVVNNTGAVGIGTTTPFGLVAFDNAAGSASQSVLTIKGNASQTGDFLSVYGGTGTKILSISQFGSLIGTNSSIQFAGAVFTSNAAGNVPLKSLGLFGGGQTADIFQIAQDTGPVYTIFNNRGYEGIGTTTPSAKLAVSGNAYDQTFMKNLFTIGSTTATATTTLFNVDNAGNVDAGGNTNQGFHLINNAVTSGNGISITTSAAGSGVVLSTVSNNPDETLTIRAKGSNGITFGNGSGATSFVSGSQVLFNGGNHNGDAGYDFRFAATNDTAISASAEQNQVIFDFNNGNATHQSANGAISIQRDYLIKAGNHQFSSYNAGANIITDAATFSIDSPIFTGPNARITNAYALLIGSTTEGTMFNASTTNTYGLTVNAAKGALNNYAATFIGGNVGIGTTSPYAQLSINPSGIVGPAFVVGSSSATLLSLGTSGAFDIGTSSNQGLHLLNNIYQAGNGLLASTTAAGNGVTLSVLSNVADESLTINPKGAGIANFATTGTGAINIGNTSSGNLVLTSGVKYRLVTNGVEDEITPSYHQFSAVTGSNVATDVRFGYIGGSADSALTASTEAPDVWFDVSGTRTHATGNIGLQRDFRVSGSIHAFAGASVITTAAAFSVDGPDSGGANGTISTSTGIYLPKKALSNVTTGISLYAEAPTGATNNYAAILMNGNVGIGTSSPWRTLSVTGTVALSGVTVSNTGNFLCLNANGEVTSGTTCTTSSERFKHNIHTLADGGLEEVLALQPVTFEFNRGYGDNGSTTQLGFIAEQAYSVDPKLVPLDAQGKPAGFMYGNYTAVLTKAIQELYGKVELVSKDATSTDGIVPFMATTSPMELVTASSTAGSTTPWAGGFATASDGLKLALSQVTNTVVHILGKGVYAVTGVFDKVFAREVHTDQICVGGTCATEAQLKALLQQAGQSGTASVGNTPTVVPPPTSTVAPDASSTPPAPSTGSTPPPATDTNTQPTVDTAPIVPASTTP